MFCLEQGRKRESSLSAQDSKELYQQSRQAIRASFGHMDKPHPNNRFVFIPGTCYPPPPPPPGKLSQIDHIPFIINMFSHTVC